MRRALFVFPLVSLVACTHGSSSDGTGPAPAAEGPSASTPTTPLAESRAKGIVIGTIVTHDSKVSILGRGPTGERDLRVVIRKTDGSLVADGLSLDQLRTVDPALHVLVTNAVAAGDDGSYVDATLESPSRGHHLENESHRKNVLGAPADQPMLLHHLH